jgi:hypothetical protein
VRGGGEKERERERERERENIQFTFIAVTRALLYCLVTIVIKLLLCPIYKLDFIIDLYG